MVVEDFDTALQILNRLNGYGRTERDLRVPLVIQDYEDLPEEWLHRRLLKCRTIVLVSSTNPAKWSLVFAVGFIMNPCRTRCYAIYEHIGGGDTRMINVPYTDLKRLLLEVK
jgi:hypothetical protein